jgi:ElaB/YqjD/DUF883 family membrane-anchored ribosome-binding protein
MNAATAEKLNATAEKLKTKGEAVIGRLAETSRHAEQLAHEARVLKTRASDLLEDSLHTAKRTVTRGVHDLEDLRDQTVIRVRRAPLAAMGVTFAAGLMLGIVVGWAGHRPRRSASEN